MALVNPLADMRRPPLAARVEVGHHVGGPTNVSEGRGLYWQQRELIPWQIAIPLGVRTGQPLDRPPNGLRPGSGPA